MLRIGTAITAYSCACTRTDALGLVARLDNPDVPLAVNLVLRPDFLHAFQNLIALLQLALRQVRHRRTLTETTA